MLQGSLETSAPARVLVVEDSEGHVRLLRRALQADGFECIAVGTGEEAFDACVSNAADVVLLDINLPGADGIAVCRQLKAAPETRLVPVLIMTGAGDSRTCLTALEAGADDFLTKPLMLPELRARVRSAARLKRYVDELDHVMAAIVMLGATIEARDRHTSGHCERIATYATGLGTRVGLSAAEVRLLDVGGFIHDLGKIAIPDAVLFKAGPLTTAEFHLMKTHTVVGDQICKPLRSLDRVHQIVRHHHELLNGTGYPDGLKHDEVPLLAQITGIADVFDAITTDRPYRRAYPPWVALEQLKADAAEGKRDRVLVGEFTALIEASNLSAALQADRSAADSSRTVRVSP